MSEPTVRRRAARVRAALGRFAVIVMVLSSAVAAVGTAAGGADDVFQAPCPAQGWYPADRDALSAMVDGFLDNAKPRDIDGDIVGLLSPHAGYPYSGPVAAFGYKALRGRVYERVVVLGPFHGLLNRAIRREDLAEVSVLDADRYETPLGTVKIDTDGAKRLLAADPRIRASRGMFIEHSVDAQIPFLQRVLPGVPILPVMLSGASLETADWLAPILKDTLAGKKTLFVASTDLSHFHPYEEAVALDGRTLGLVSALDLARIDRTVDGSDMCGRGDVLVVLKLFKLLGGGDVMVLDRRNSGDTSGQKDRVVGYASVVLVQHSAPRSHEKERPGRPGPGRPADTKPVPGLKETVPPAPDAGGTP